MSSSGSATRPGSIEALLDAMEHLPSQGNVALQVLWLADDPSTALEDLAGAVAGDPALVARLLRLANSAYYHVSRTVGSVNDALAMLGFVTVRTLVISSGLTGGYKAMPGIDLSQFWRC